MSNPKIILTSKFVYYAPKSRQNKTDYGRYAIDYMGRKKALEGKEYLSLEEQAELKRIENQIEKLDDNLELVDSYSPKFSKKTDLAKANEAELNKDSLGNMNEQDYAHYLGYMMRKDALEKKSQSKDLSHEEKTELNKVKAGMEKYDLPDMNKDKVLQGYFTSDQEVVRLEDMENVRQKMRNAQLNESVMWQDVISFDNEYLRKMNIYDPTTGYLDEAGIRKASGKMMATLTEKEKLNHPFWTASIHRNTDNIHIHFSIVESANSREIVEYQGIKEPRGKRKLSTISAMKTSFTGTMFDASEMLKEMNEQRNKITKAMKDTFKEAVKEPNFQKNLNEFIKELPDKRKHWRWADLDSKQKNKLNQLSEHVMGNNPDYQEWNNLFTNYQDYYQAMYGKSKDNSKNKAYQKWTDMHYRMGNSLLSELKEIDKKSKNYREKLPHGQGIDPDNYIQECLKHLDKDYAEKFNKSIKAKKMQALINEKDFEKQKKAWQKANLKKYKRKKIARSLEHNLKKNSVRPVIRKATSNKLYGRMQKVFDKEMTSKDKQAALLEYEKLHQTIPETN